MKPEDKIIPIHEGDDFLDDFFIIHRPVCS